MLQGATCYPREGRTIPRHELPRHRCRSRCHREGNDCSHPMIARNFERSILATPIHYDHLAVRLLLTNCVEQRRKEALFVQGRDDYRDDLEPSVALGHGLVASGGTVRLAASAGPWQAVA